MSTRRPVAFQRVYGANCQVWQVMSSLAASSGEKLRAVLRGARRAISNMSRKTNARSTAKDRMTTVLENWYRHGSPKDHLPMDIINLLLLFILQKGGICYVAGYNWQGECGVKERGERVNKLSKLTWTDTPEFAISSISHVGDFYSVFLTTNGHIYTW